MKFSNVVTLLAAASSASAFAIDLGQSPIGSFDEPVSWDATIPGGSPIVHCSDPATDLVKIDRIYINPNPPAVGKTLHLEASGEVKRRIEEGAIMKVEVKLGYITLIKQTLDFCSNLEKANTTVNCPIEPGPLKIVKDQDLPKEIPPGKFKVTAELYTEKEDGDLITCLHAEVTFARR
ncbi:Phosphatidylglycerol/phosphatidylinositol transfer protein [Orbilia oligospora]|uniref:Phosphatidylglycerol/phosphatidylinositol transfer protein n=2 Tax=Orbilia oligospora TaxID=2813651 RepID=G1X5A2_ARTOA|nr:hypothetical protein AOL_s00054g46 [Orbilia oligospora ATCC 24927]EGX51647.1 hypothetical protein AOL_s00054g46 [Orbilia oligospora ATCC 24927]KAF3281657.1 Phosphatidylglycerol/phosphatidylinositol transfer protein [Orbilia oligospora]KAF3311598.1 Phosphatidylglycerol/phosphatidylinositol transfer protein [Orbilia oligospora]